MADRRLDVDEYDIENYNERGMLLGVPRLNPTGEEAQRVGNGSEGRKRTAGGGLSDGNDAKRPNKEQKENEREKSPKKEATVPKEEDEEWNRRYSYNDDEIQIIPAPVRPSIDVVELSSDEEDDMDDGDDVEGEEKPTAVGEEDRPNSQETISNETLDGSTPEIHSQEILALQRPSPPQKISQKTGRTGASGDIFDETPEIVVEEVVVSDDESDEDEGSEPPLPPPRDYPGMEDSINLDSPVVTPPPLDFPSPAGSPASLSPVGSSPSQDVTPGPRRQLIFSDSSDSDGGSLGRSGPVAPPSPAVAIPVAPVAHAVAVPVAPAVIPLAPAVAVPVAPAVAPVAPRPPVAADSDSDDDLIVRRRPVAPAVAPAVAPVAHVAAVARPVTSKTILGSFGGRKKKQPVKSGRDGGVASNWLNEIRRMQRSTELQIPKASFGRLVREITADLTPEQTAENGPIRWQAAALSALQDASESYVTDVLEDCNLLALHAGRVTIQPADIRLSMRLRGLKDPGNGLNLR